MILAVSTLAMSVLVKKSATPRDTASIAGTAIVLANCDQLVARLREEFSSPDSTTESSVARDFCWTSGSDAASQREPPTSFRIDICAQKPGIQRRVPTKSTHMSERQWYKPILSYYSNRVGLLLVLIGLIVTLELLHRRPDFANGILQVPCSESYARFAWTYLPAAFMTSCAVLISMLYFNATILQPDDELAKRPQAGGTYLLRNYLGSHSLLYALRYRQIRFVAAALSALAGSFLSIAVSGLYTARAVASVAQSSLTQTH